MFAVFVVFKVKPGCMADFMPLMRAQARNSLMLEAACRRFDVCTGGDDPDEVFLYELYDDKTAFDLHLASQHFLDFDKASSEFIVSREIRIFAEVSVASAVTTRSLN